MQKMKYFLVLMAVCVVFACGCVQDETVPAEGEVQKEVVGTEYIGGKYNLTIVKTKITANNKSGVMNMIRYVKDGAVIEPDMMLGDGMRPGLEWIRENTPEDAVVLSWWDYGHMIRAYAEMEPVVDAPSREILVTTVSKHIGKSPSDVECQSCVSHEVIRDVAGALVARDASVLMSVMDDYEASVFYVRSEDEFKSFAFYVSVGEEPADIKSDEFSKTLIGRASRGEDIDGFVLAYSDESARIYTIDGLNAQE